MQPGSPLAREVAGNSVKLSAIQEALSLACLVPAREDADVRVGLASDLLSEALGRAVKGCLLVTVLTNLNVIAVAAYAGIAAVVITSGYRPSEEVLGRAREEGIPLFSTPAETFDVVGQLSRLGIRGNSAKEIR